MLPNIPFDKYKNIIDAAHHQLNQETLLWKRHLNNFERYGEDSEVDSADTIELKCLIQYNYFRSWPIGRDTPSGNLDMQTMLVYFNRRYLMELGYIEPDGMFAFSEEFDHFIHHGLKYKAKGYSPAAQAGNQPLFVFIILEREELENVR
jgi:hypothetical protein